MRFLNATAQHGSLITSSLSRQRHYAAREDSDVIESSRSAQQMEITARAVPRPNVTGIAELLQDALLAHSSQRVTVCPAAQEGVLGSADEIYAVHWPSRSWPRGSLRRVVSQAHGPMRALPNTSSTCTTLSREHRFVYAVYNHITMSWFCLPHPRAGQDQSASDDYDAEALPLPFGEFAFTSSGRSIVQDLSSHGEVPEPITPEV